MSLLIFLSTLLLIVLIHEYGHYRTALWFDVAIERFSIGFGRPIWTYYAKKKQVEFALAPFLFGGYVKFAQQARPQQLLFDDLSIGRQILILLAGPFANLLSAFVLLFIVYSLPLYQAKAFILSQDKTYQIIAVNQRAVETWSDVWARIQNTSNKLSLELKQAAPIVLELKTPAKDLDGFLKMHALAKALPPVPPIVGQVMPGSLAEQIGLRADDRILAINQIPVQSIYQLATMVKQFSSQGFELEWQHYKQHRRIKIAAQNKKHIRLGIQSYSFEHYPNLFVRKRLSWQASFKEASFSYMTLFLMQSKAWLGLNNHLHELAGPIGLAMGAHEAWYEGLKTYLMFVIYLSMGIGIVNLLPLPILDGGQCFLLIAKRFFPKLLTENVKKILIFWSVFALLILFLLGSSNDWALLQK